MSARSHHLSRVEAAAAVAVDAEAVALHPDFAPRALSAGPAYWITMLAASALGTNLGDLWVDRLFHNRLTSLASLILICGLAIWQDRSYARRTEAAYWVAIVALRTAATNLADYMTHDLALGYVTVTIVLGGVTLAMARFTTPDHAKGEVPRVDGWYWIAMLFAGLFGTVGGDLTSHTIGLFAASGAFCVVLFCLVSARGAVMPASMLLYWCIILAERCAGTAIGDSLASGRGLALGLPIATSLTAGLFAVALLARARLERR